jgi:hypothetical protein
MKTSSRKSSGKIAFNILIDRLKIKQNFSAKNLKGSFSVQRQGKISLKKRGKKAAKKTHQNELIFEHGY